MSLVSSVMLIVSCVESSIEEDREDYLPAIEQWFAENKKPSLKHLTPAYGGDKHPQTEAYGGGINYFDEDKFADYVGSIPWDKPECVVLVIQPEDGPTRVWKFINRSWALYP